MRPAEPRKSSNVASAISPAALSSVDGPSVPPAPPLPTPATPLAHNPPRPIGTDAMRRLREAIQSGEYPNDAAVRTGLERLIRREE